MGDAQFRPGISRPRMSSGRLPKLERSQRWFVAGIFVVVLVLVITVLVIGHVNTWEDEVFAVSTGWSMAHLWPQTLSVLGQFPGTGSPIRFYGPVSFEVAAWLIQAFGLSATVWRLACFAGVIITLCGTVGLVRLGGGDRWAQLTAALVITFAGATGIFLPGRWDWVSSGLFVGGLLLFLRGVESGGRALCCGAPLAGVLIGISLASTPRTLTLCLGALISTVTVAFFFPIPRRRLLGGGSVVVATSALCQTLLLLPWHMNSLSWIAMVRRSGRQDGINLTPVAGRGGWDFDIRDHRTVLWGFALLLVTCLLVGPRRREVGVVHRKRPIRILLALTAFLNLAVMLALLKQAFGDVAYWLPISLAAAMCWLEVPAAERRTTRFSVAGLILASLSIFAVKELRTVAAILISWDQHSETRVTAFVRRTVPRGSIVYGPVGGFFFPVELAGDRYLYPLELTTPGLYSKNPRLTEMKLDETICAHPTYVMWPLLNTLRLAPGLPRVVITHLGREVGTLEPPPLTAWEKAMLNRIVRDGSGYRSPKVAVYSLRGSVRCGAPVGSAEAESRRPHGLKANGVEKTPQEPQGVARVR